MYFAGMELVLIWRTIIIKGKSKDLIDFKLLYILHLFILIAGDYFL